MRRKYLNIYVRIDFHTDQIIGILLLQQHKLLLPFDSFTLIIRKLFYAIMKRFSDVITGGS